MNSSELAEKKSGKEKSLKQEQQPARKKRGKKIETSNKFVNRFVLHEYNFVAICFVVRFGYEI